MSQLWEWVTLGIPRLQMRVRLSTHLTRHHNRKTLAGISSKPLNQTHKLLPQKGWAIKVTQWKPLGNICMAPSRATHQLHLACPTEQLPHSHTPPIRLLPFSHLPEHQLPSSAPSDAILHSSAWPGLFLRPLQTLQASCRSQWPGSHLSPPSDLAESKGHGSLPTSGTLDIYFLCDPRQLLCFWCLSFPPKH